MSDELLTRLRERAASPAASSPLTDDLIGADLARGRSAVRRDRFRRGVGLLGACAVTGIVASVTLSGSPETAPPLAAPSATVSSPADAPATSSAPPAPTRALRLVAYEGTQPEGFRLTTVPEGFRVVGSDPFALVLAGPNDPGTHPGSFTDRVVVLLASADAAPAHDGTPVRVGDHDGVIWETGDAGTRVLSYTDAAGNPVDVQVWKSIALSDAQLVDMASGITVTSEAIQGVG